MQILGVETSCDETGVALVRDGSLVGECLASQTDMHALFGGVVPEIASREHLRIIPLLFAELMRKTGACASDLDAVAVARGPGLMGSLLVGLSFAKGLCVGTGASLVGVNHLHAHLLAPGLEQDILFPALGLLVSGGHTHTYRIDAPTLFALRGRTLDDAAGEAFDKVAKLLNLPYPGGRHLDALAQGAEADHKLFPRAFIDNESLDFSFSGLKTAVATYLAAHPELKFAAMPSQAELTPAALHALSAHPEELGRVCASFNWAVADTLRIKVERVLRQELGIRSLVVAGGVAANSAVRTAMAALAQEHKLQLCLPSPGLCTDNAAMIGYAGWCAMGEGFRHGLNLEAVPRGKAVPQDWLRCRTT